jgi:hypothetical protein
MDPPVCCTIYTLYYNTLVIYLLVKITAVVVDIEYYM